MFGTLKPHTCRLGCDKRHEYAALYCGLCKSLGDHFGQLTRGLLNYDAVFLALVADGLAEEGAAPDRCRCPLLPVAFRPTVRPDSPAMRYAAAMQMLLADQWLADRAVDGRVSARIARPLLDGKVSRAREMLSELGISLADLDGFEERQRRVEVHGEVGPRDAAEPTAAALEIVFSRMTLLPGVPAEGRAEASRTALAAFGRHLGSAIYLTDALDDLEKDHGRGDYNPCLTRRRGGELCVSWARVEAAWGLLSEDLAALADLVEALLLLRHRDLVRSVVAVELPRQARAAAARAHAYARAEEQRRRARPWPHRALAAVATAFVLLWVWLTSLPAFAKGPPRPTRDAGASGSTHPDRREPQLPSPEPTSEPKPPDPADTSPSGKTAPGGASSPGGTDPTKPGAAPVPGGAAPVPGGGGCSNPCSGCGSSNPCSGCGSSNPCSGCGDCCKACDCNACCKGGDCNGCCNVCNGCGCK